MVGCLHWIVLAVGLEGRLLLLPIFWRVGLVVMCVKTSTAGLSRRTGLRRYDLEVLRLLLMSGLMAVWCRMRCLGVAVVVLVCFRLPLGLAGFRGLEDTWSDFHLMKILVLKGLGCIFHSKTLADCAKG